MKKQGIAQTGVDRPLTPEYKMYSFEESAAAISHILKFAETVRRAGRGSNDLYNDLIIGADTETSKTGPDEFDETGRYIPQENIVVAWTISIRCESGNICTIWGLKPSEMMKFIKELHETLEGEKTIFYWHNMAYDFWFLQKFCVRTFGVPVKQLNTKPHYPVTIEFENGIIFKDSLIIAQKSLERWANELEVEHRKAAGFWDYNKKRNQKGCFTPEELEYIEHDTLALVECLDKLKLKLHKPVYSIPITCTAIIREVVRNEGRRNRAKNRFERIAPSYELYNKLVQSYHGGFVHNNRFAGGEIWPEPGCNEHVIGVDFCSSYPYVCLTEPMPGERFRRLPDERLNRKWILKNADICAYCLTFRGWNVMLKEIRTPMPVLQLSKCIKCIDPVLDNGRILSASYIEIVINEIDLSLIDMQYKFTSHECVDVYAASKRPLPRWFRDIVYKCFMDKTELKGGDVVEYALAKARLRKVNSLYGMMAQRSCREDIIEDFETGEYMIKYWNNEEEKETFTNSTIEEQDEIIEKWNRKKYEDYLNNHNSILPFYWGCWVTSAAMKNLFTLSKCIKPESEGGLWLYSDTDSIYTLGIDWEKLKEYNEGVKEKIRNAGYGPVVKDGREYWPGLAEIDGEYKQFIGLHSKCYAVRKLDDTIKITVAGVPKKGAAVLKSLEDFRDGFIFPGKKTGKLTHYYISREDISIDAAGNEHGDSVDLHECDYVIGLPKIDDFIKIISEQEINMQVYEDE